MFGNDNNASDERYKISVELSYNELKRIILAHGFKFLHEKETTTTYCSAGSASMRKTAYEAMLFTAKKC